MGNKWYLLLLVDITFFGGLIVIEPGAVTIIIELLGGSKFIHIRLPGLIVVELIIDYRCSVFDVLPLHLLIECLQLLPIASAPPKRVIILRVFAVITTILVVGLPIRHL